MGSGQSDNFQGRAGRIGKTFATWCEVTLESVGFVLRGKIVIKEAGIEIDQVAENRSGEKLYLQFKGSSKPPRPGLRRTDTVKKALCDAFLMDRLGIGPYLIVTSHKPKEGTSAARMIECAGDTVFDIICINDDDDFARLESYVDVLPWRSKIVAKTSTLKPRPDERPAQPSLLGIKSLRGLSKSGEKMSEKPNKPRRRPA